MQQRQYADAGHGGKHELSRWLSHVKIVRVLHFAVSLRYVHRFEHIGSGRTMFET